MMFPIFSFFFSSISLPLFFSTYRSLSYHSTILLRPRRSGNTTDKCTNLARKHCRVLVEIKIALDIAMIDRVAVTWLYTNVNVP